VIKVEITYKDINNVVRTILVDKNIKELDLSTKGIVSLEPRNFFALTELEILWLHGNNIDYLHQDTFWGLEKLKKLYLYYNKIKTIPKGLFSPLKSLLRIELSMNQISSLEEETFVNNTLLEKIVIDFNQLYELPEKIFQNLPNINTLVLSSNNLISLPPLLFQNLKKIRFLSLSFNSLSNLPKNLFSKNHESLEEIRLDNNPFRELDLTCFQFTANLKKIDVLYCTGLEKVILDPVQNQDEIINVPDAKIDFSATALSYPPPVIISRGLRAIVGFFSPEKTIFSTLTEIRMSFGLPSPEIKVDKCVLCKKPIFENDRNVCPDCEDFYSDYYALGA
jgi:Leucine-rich repeat (LRR) protein